MVLKKDIKSFIIVIVFGILMGSLCAVLDLFPSNNIWTFSSFSGSVGFWAITGMIVLMQSDNWKLAGINTFLYFAFMNATFFFVYLLLPIQFPRVTTLYDASIQALAWTIPSFICGVCAIIAYLAKRDDWKGIIALSLPTGVLLCEFVGVLSSVFINHKYLFQTLVDIVGLIILFMLYKGKKKILYLIPMIILVGGLLILFEVIMYHNIFYY